VHKCVIDRTVVLDGVNPTLIPREVKPERVRKERTA
jgi:hypothetical protein